VTCWSGTQLPPGHARCYLLGADGIPRDLAKAKFLCDEVIARGKYFVTAYHKRKYAVSELAKS
jgi:hypothetical protein